LPNHILIKGWRRKVWYGEEEGEGGVKKRKRAR
jgi:hypothetical protein